MKRVELRQDKIVGVLCFEKVYGISCAFSNASSTASFNSSELHKTVFISESVDDMKNAMLF